MPLAVTIPRLGWTMEEGVFGGWLKQDGEQVQPGDSLFTLESEKASEDVEALDGGILRIPADGPRPGDTVRVGQEIGSLLQPGEANAVRPQPATASVAPASPSVRQLAREKGIDLNGLTGTGRSGRITNEDVQRVSRPVAPPEAVASPRARRVAAELGVDWKKLQGSGSSGRIRERDVRAARSQPAAASTEGAPKDRVRQRIAEHLMQSVQTTAPVTLTTTADATNLVNLRGQFQKAGGEALPGYTDFIVKLSAAALRQHPALNARWEDGAAVLEPAIHIGIAVDTDAGLLVPVVRDAAKQSLREIAACTRGLADRARQRQLRADEMHGGTFTVTNLGGFGIDAFTPIIPIPQCAILGIGRIQKQPVVVGEQVVIRDRVTLSLTFDHRLVDGAPAARFLQTLVGLIENPAPALMG